MVAKRAKSLWSLYDRSWVAKATPRHASHGACGGHKVVSTAIAGRHAGREEAEPVELVGVGRGGGAGACVVVDAGLPRRLLADRGGEGLRVAGHLQPEPAAVRVHPVAHQQHHRGPAAQREQDPLRPVAPSALSGPLASPRKPSPPEHDISYVEDGAFSALFNLQVLQMGFNRLRNLTEAMLRGLGKLQYLYLQANLIESVSANAFWECLDLENVDLSMNRLQVLDGGTFHGLPKLSTCEVYSNPFSCTCELLASLRWLANFPNRTRERMACDSPPGFHGYSLLSQNPRMPTYRNAFHALKTVCADDPRSGGPGANTYLFGPGGVGEWPGEEGFPAAANRVARSALRGPRLLRTSQSARVA
ncbi:hypothetical protein AALO_G00090180 [Alosa alosa]|uniref:Uncharacterized protein n=1 Tax=Alosa alosa TaxID=278164 RepID=A0AAV6GSJ2_9TELE|nr:hypothetical protein AALO_G00090180 [Alosa alosa]